MLFKIKFFAKSNVKAVVTEQQELIYIDTDPGSKPKNT